MGKDMIISVLIPTRKRSQLVERSIKSLLANASDSSRIEIMIAHDLDDLESKEYFCSEQWKSTIESFGAISQVFETPAWGYNSLHTYYNFLAEKSKGQWLLIWNDDALMKSNGWDAYVEANKDFVGLLHMLTENYRSKFALFPLIPRTWIELFGYVGEIPVDSWIHHICMEAQAIKIIEPITYHDRYDMTGNNLDETYQNRNTSIIKKNYKSEESKAVRHQWAQKLKNYIDTL
jgi:hypothetical protein